MRFLVVLTVFASIGAFGQKLNFGSFEDDFVSAKFIYDFEQTSNGYLYIASSKGLVKYDGIKFELINEQNGLLNEFVHEIAIDQEDQIWIAYYTGGVSCLKGSNIVHYDQSLMVKSIFQDESNTIYTTTSTGVFQIKEGRFVKSKQFEKFSEVISLSNESFIALDDEQNLYFIDDLDKSTLLEKNVQSIHSNNDNFPFVALIENQLVVYEGTDNQTPRKEITITYDEIKVESAITSTLITEQKVFLGTENSGLIEIYLNPLPQTYSIKKFDSKNGLCEGRINSLFIDNERTLWIGSYGEGICYLPSIRISTHQIDESKLSNHVNAIEYLNGELILGTNDGLRMIQTDSSKFQIPEFKNVKINALYEHSDTLWIGSQEGLYYMHNLEIKKFQFQELEYQPRMINAIQVHDNILYLGTNSGFYIHEFESGIEKLSTTNDGLAHNVISHFVIDQNRVFWFASPNSPIYSYQNQEFIYHKDIDGFESYNVNDIWLQSNGDLWFATDGDGIFLRRNNEFKQLNESSGLLSNYVYFIESTEDSKIICGHKNGLSIVEEKEGEFDIMNSDYIPELEYLKFRSSYLTASNYLWIGTAKGCINIPRINQLDEKFIPNLNFRYVKVDHESFNTSESIAFPYGDYYLEIGFEAVMLKYAESVSFEYILDGFDQEWTAVNNENQVARYQSVKDGEYTFKVRLYINDVLTDKEIQIPISIEKPVWKKTWFYILITLLIIIIFFGSLWIVNRRNKKIQLHLQSEVRKRTNDLTVKNNEINKVNAELAELSNQYLEAKNIAEEQTDLMKESIRYAQYIQKGLLRQSQYQNWISDAFGEFFLLFKPKDIVSGDFYWGYKSEKYNYVVAADCTGHGVPGAMISMLGASYLKDIIHEEEETEKILDSLRTKIINSFGQDNDSSIHDGMDITLFRLDPTTKMGQVSGAMNAPIIIRSKEINKEPEESFELFGESSTHYAYSFRVDRQPIGHHFLMKEFTHVDFQMYEGDQIYLMSDGYVDQFGSNDRGKFKRKNLIDLLLDIAELSSEEQKAQMWTVMQEWMGETEQIDDITVIGVKIK